MRLSFVSGAAVILLPLLGGCHRQDRFVECTIVNGTGAPVQELQFEYPNASFGTQTLAAGAKYHYRFLVDGTGPLKVSYAGPAHETHEAKSAFEVHAGQQGSLEVDLAPGADAPAWHPSLTE